MGCWHEEVQCWLHLCLCFFCVVQRLLELYLINKKSFISSPVSQLLQLSVPVVVCWLVSEPIICGALPICITITARIAVFQLAITVFFVLSLKLNGLAQCPPPPPFAARNGWHDKWWGRRHKFRVSCRKGKVVPVNTMKAYGVGHSYIHP